MLALIDGDILIYRCSFAAEHTRYTLVDEESGVPIKQFESAADMKAFIQKESIEKYLVEKEREYEPLANALANLKSVMSTILDTVSQTNYHVFLSKGQCFRHGIATIKEYKGHRKDVPRPLYYNEAREYLSKYYNSTIVESIEADDALAMLQDEDSVIVSIDKDLLQVPGKHYNWVKDEKMLVTPEVGLRRLYQQVLSGDSTDNIPGIKGVGEITARKILAEVPATKQDLSAACTAAWEVYLKSPKNTEFENEGGWKYTGWDGKEYVKTAQEIAVEVYQLVNVGGMCAKDALTLSGESLPDPREKKG